MRSTRPASKATAVLGSLLATVAATPAAAQNADTELVEKLAPEIAKNCRRDPATMFGWIAAGDLGRAIFASKTVPLSFEYGWSRNGGQLIAEKAFGPDLGDNEDSLLKLRRLAQTWTNPDDAAAASNLPLAAGGVEVLDRRGWPVSANSAQQALAAILDGDDGDFRFRCLAPALGTGDPPAQPAPAQKLRAPLILLTRSPGDLAKAELADRPYAEIAYVNDRDAKKDSLSLYATVGLSWPDIVLRSPRDSAATGNSMVRLAPTLFAQLEREESGPSEADDVNNLNFGFQLAGFLQTRSPAVEGRDSRTSTHALALDARYLTDTRLDSNGWAVAARFTPDIPLPGNHIAWTIPGTLLKFRWRLTGVADHISISDPGKKAELVGAPEYTRLGFDLSGLLKYRLGEESDQSISLGLDYALRQRLGHGRGNAQLLSARLLFNPVANLSFGIAYDRGENLDTLEHGDTVKLTLGLRR